MSGIEAVREYGQQFRDIVVNSLRTQTVGDHDLDIAKFGTKRAGAGGRQAGAEMRCVQVALFVLGLGRQNPEGGNLVEFAGTEFAVDGLPGDRLIQFQVSRCLFGWARPGMLQSIQGGRGPEEFLILQV